MYQPIIILTAKERDALMTAVKDAFVNHPEESFILRHVYTDLEIMCGYSFA